MHKARTNALALEDPINLIDSLEVPSGLDWDKTRRFEIPPEHLAALARRSLNTDDFGFSPEEAASFSSRVTPAMGVRKSIIDREAALCEIHDDRQQGDNADHLPIVVNWEDEHASSNVISHASEERRVLLAKLLFACVLFSALGLLVYALTLASAP